MLITTSLSGCTGNGDGPQFELSSDEIQDLIDENIDDFLNNTTITVVNNYYNNTTIDQSGSSSTSSEINNYNGTGTLYSSSGTATGIENVYVPAEEGVLLVREDAFSATVADNSVSGLNGAQICVGIGTSDEGEVVGWFSSMQISFTSVPVADAAEATAKFIDGSCDAMYIDSFSAASQKKSALDGDGSMNGVSIWIADPSLDMNEVDNWIGNSLSITIQQDEDEMLTGFEYAYAQVTLYAICMENLSENCNDDEYIFTTNTWGVNLESATTCSGNVSLDSFSGYTDNLFNSEASTYYNNLIFGGAGLNCTHDFTIVIDLYPPTQVPMPSFIGNPNYVLSWSDWTYSFVWESVPISN